MEMRVNPTRMELKKLQARYATARRGHKLLKDKCDGLMQQFLEIVREARALRAELEPKLVAAYASFAAAGAVSDPKMMQTALLLPRMTQQLEVTTRNRMSVNVPQFTPQTGGEKELFNYGFAFTGSGMDRSVSLLCELGEPMVRLAQLEKEAMLMADEIERTRRRVNALEHIMIPQYLSGIRQIKLKLDENERGNITRLMKVKDMMLAAQLQQRKDFIPDEPDFE